MDYIVERTLEWFQKYGTENAGPNRRNITVGKWVDPIVRIRKRRKAILKAIKGKALLAFWGNSQTGKSLFMGWGIDGDDLLGADSAVTWGEHKARFSTPAQGASDPNADTVILNSFNNYSDGTGLVCIFTLKGENDGINVDFPVEVFLTSSQQLIQSISNGYLSECRCKLERNYPIVFDSARIRKLIPSAGNASGYRSLKESYPLQGDIADAIDMMRNSSKRFFFVDEEEWNATRQAIVDSEGLRNDEEAVKFIETLFWDDVKEMTDFYKRTRDMLNTLRNQWKGRRVLASMEVAKLLIDISSYKSCFETNTDNEWVEKYRRDIAGLSYEMTEKEVHLFISRGKTNSQIADNFGVFQAVCAELTIPIRKSRLKPSRKQFLQLMEQCDIMDCPGIGSFTDSSSKNSEVLDPSKRRLTECEIATVFMKGKTLSILYDYIRDRRIDAFSIMARADRDPLRPELINAGIAAWLRSFDPAWNPGDPLPLPVMLNTTFSSTMVNAVHMNGTKNFKQYVERIQKFNFARPVDNMLFSRTTYPAITEGMINEKADATSIEEKIRREKPYVAATKMEDGDIRNLFGPDGGEAAMIDQLVKLEIKTDRREKYCNEILARDMEECISLFQSQLPAEPEAAAKERSDILRQCKAALDTITVTTDDDVCIDTLNDLKWIYSVEAEMFDPLPLSIKDTSPSPANQKAISSSFVNAQDENWFTWKMSTLKNAPCDGAGLITDKQRTEILQALHDSIGENEVEQLAGMILKEYGNIKNMQAAVAARKDFAIAFSNMLRNRSITIQNDSIIGDGAPAMLAKFTEGSDSPYIQEIAFLKKQIADLANVIVKDTRADLPGCAELQALFDLIRQD